MLPTDAFYTILQYDDNLKYRALNSGIKCIHEKLILNFDLVFCLENDVVGVMKQYDSIILEYDKIKSYAINKKTITNIRKSITSTNTNLSNYVNYVSNFEYEYNINNYTYDDEHTISYESTTDDVNINIVMNEDIGYINIYINKISIEYNNDDGVSINDLHINSKNKKQILTSIIVMALIVKIYAGEYYVDHFGPDLIDELINKNIDKNEIIKIIKCTDLDLGSFDL
jgi:hypothetical protein